MAWAQRRGPSRPSSTVNPPVQMYNPNQHSNTEWQATDPQAWYTTQQQQQQPFKPEVNQPQHYWQQPQPTQVYPTPSQTPNANSTAQYHQYQQDQAGYYPNSGGGYDQQAYGNVQYNQQYNQNHGQSGQPAVQQSATEADAWGNWGWDDEDISNAQPVVSQQPIAASVNHSVGDSFTTNESWNWSAMDSRQPSQTDNATQEEQNINNPFPKIGDLKKFPPKLENHVETVKSNRNKLETPQWSTESQPSLESSDDVLPTSESDKSHKVSRSSTISHSPISGQESSPLAQGSVGSSNTKSFVNTQYHVENKEFVKQEVPESRPARVNPTPPPPINMQTPPLFPPSQGSSDESRNMYKRSGALSHRSATKFRATNATPPDSRQPPLPPSFNNQSVNLETLPDNSEHPDYPHVSSSVKTNINSHQQWPQTENNQAPINDRNQYLETGQLSEVNLTEGNEVDVGNDTLPPPGLQRMIPGQLEQKEVGVGRMDEPLPGFSRMVLGQNESGPSIPSGNQSQFDLTGPPEGLHRMVPGESSSPETSLHQQNIEENDSELELNQLAQNSIVQPPRSATIGADTPPIIQNRPILAPPSHPPSHLPANRSETIGGDLCLSSGGDKAETTHVRGASISSSENKPTRISKSKEKTDQQENRREAVEGQTNDTDISNLTNSVRNLTVGENLTDGQTSNNSLPEHSPRRHSRQESSDSESDRKQTSRNRRDKRSAEKAKPRDKEKDRYSERDRYRDRGSDRYSPDPYREKTDRRDRRYVDRRYQEDTDYYSDKEKDRRNQDDRDRDYERKYSSLRKDKDRRRKDRDPRDPRDTRDLRDPRDYRESRRNDYHYARYGDDYGPENRSSRPSSRSDSIHESYRDRRHEPDPRERRHRERDREKERERYRNRDPRDVYNPYQNFAYDPYNPYYQQYQYYENLRRTNPQAYAEWYRKYYQQATGSNASFTGDDRASVHSGRSSANDELTKDRYTRQSFYSQSSMANYYGQSHSISGHYGLDNSSYNRTFDQTDNTLIYEQQQSAAQRLTPAKFATAHMKASINSGKLIQVLPNYPMDGQNAIVELCSLQAFLENDPDYFELSSFPGPLVQGVTHKKQIIEYCETKIKGAAYNRDTVDVESYILMWELLILLIRLNGMVLGTDIAELLLKNRSIEPAPRPPSVLSTTSSNAGDKNDISEGSNLPVSEHGSIQSILKEEEVTRKFREYLLYGSCKEALEWAMKHGLWGHALFLASKLDKRTYANVMMRFANGLTISDPLQTLYQLLSGKMPAVVTCASDEKWGDWRPHLAMILSNSTHRPELNCKAIRQLGNTLFNRGSLYAAQFCYLMAEVGFGKHGDPETRLVLLGSDHRKAFPEFVTNEAIHMTEIYEYACSLNDKEFVITEFQFYKYLLATRLADFGLLERALQYLEKLSGYIIYNPSGVSPVLIDRVCELSDRLKFYDPVGDVEDESEFGGLLETSRPDNSWLKDLRAVQNDYQTGRIVHESYTNNPDLQSTLNTDETLQQSPYNPAQDIWQQQQQQYDQQQQHQFEQQQQQFDQQQKMWQIEQPQPTQDCQVQENQQQQNDGNRFQDQTNYWSDKPAHPWGDQLGQYDQESSNFEQQQQDKQIDYYETSNNHNEQEVETEPAEDHIVTQPQISMPNQPKGQNAFENEPLPNEKLERKAGVPQAKPQSPKLENKQSTGWFGGIFSKLARPKNQMKLPDDKNPKIVWDENKKRWVNVDGDSNDTTSDFKPPPKMSDLIPKMPTIQPTQTPGMGYINANSSSDYNSLHQLTQTHNMGYTSANISSLDYSSGNINSDLSVNHSSFNADQNKSSGLVSLPAIGISATQNEDVGPPKTAQPNMFKMQRGRNLKTSYVDIFKQNGAKSTTGHSTLSAPEKVPINAPAQMNFFVPQLVADPNAPVDFLTPGGAPVQIGEQQMSRWSSTSSLSREVASYMHKSDFG